MDANDKIADVYTFPNFEPEPHCSIDDVQKMLVIALRETDRPQKVCARVVVATAGRCITPNFEVFAICLPADFSSRFGFRCGICTVRGAA